MLKKIIFIMILSILLGVAEAIGMDIFKKDKSKLTFLRILHITYGYIAYAILNG